MTTIAYRDGIMAGDGRYCCNGWVHGENAVKVHKLSRHRLVGFTGEYHLFNAFLEWLRTGEGERPVLKDGRCVEVDTQTGIAKVHEETGYFEITEEYHAWGSGSPAALAAMHAGASAKEAVEIAARLDTCTGGTIRSVSAD